ncbi:hypothetical protein BDR26DRAFT_929157 [Obelidium mucronatum]|nr:hypothetical protein BDR26DRAFT_929157 [Obelidium mucronatum]
MTSPKDMLKAECEQLRAADIPVKLKPASAASPFPLVVTVRVPQPADCHMYDVHELVFTLTIASFASCGDAAVGVDAAANGIDARLAAAICAAVARAGGGGGGGGGGWRLVERAAFVRRSFRALLALVPGTLDAYMGEDADGKSMRRFAPAFLPDEKGAGDKEAEDAERMRKKEAEEAEAREYWRLQKLKEEQLELERQKQLAEEKRLEYERDPSLFEKPRQLSKKEVEEMHKSKQGVRMAKTGPNKKKFDPEAAAARKEARGERISDDQI